MASKSPAKSPAKAKRKAVPRAHPQYKVMIDAAIKSLASKGGSSKPAIAKYIAANYKVGDRHNSLLKSALLRGIKDGSLEKKTGVGCSGSFKLPKAVSKKKKIVSSKSKRATPKKKAVPKKRAAGPKKVAPKKKAVPKKKKAAPKKKPAAKKAVPKKAGPKKAKK